MRYVDREFRGAAWVKQFPEAAAALGLGEWDDEAQGWWYPSQRSPAPNHVPDAGKMVPVQPCGGCGKGPDLAAMAKDPAAVEAFLAGD